ncbi:MAG: DNA repair protein RadA [Gammaproteobacteria bacterium]
MDTVAVTLPKQKKIYQCTQCEAQFGQWAGQCGQCGQWNSLQEEQIFTAPSKNVRAKPVTQVSKVTALSEVSSQVEARMVTGLGELDRVLGGGLVVGSVVLLGGDPGIGKSTLLVQTLALMSQQHQTLYISGEESLQQISARAQRLNLPADHLLLLAETQLEQILKVLAQKKAQIVVIDSIQTVFSQLIASAPGSVSQVRECAAQLVQYAKQNNIALFLVGHVTKEGALAGPRVLEHMVDTVLYFEGQKDARFRVIRAVKNRFGAVNELGVFAMTDKGLRPVNNPSALFLSHYDTATSGSIVMVTWSGSRPLLAEVQALVDGSHGQDPRRVTLGLEQNRLAMLLAVLHRHGGIATHGQDIFINVVGGVRVSETAADLAVVLAILSSLKDQPIDNKLIVFGELGLAGEVRPVQGGQERLQEAVKHGFKKAIVPYANAPKQAIAGMTVLPVKHLHEALAYV